jgi:SEC-C motif-containing protein
MTKALNCPCKSGLPYKNCCEKFHKRSTLPANASELMRSRFSAYAIRLVDYIIDTTHPENASKPHNLRAWKKDLLGFAQNTRFEDLKILDFVHGDNDATVTFHATLKQGSKDASFTEKSIFYKVDGKWLYHSGTFPPGSAAISSAFNQQ